MNLGLNDLHLVLSASARRLEVWNANHQLEMGCEARNRTTANGQYGHDGNCPPGEFVLGGPVAKGTVPFGKWFIPILDYGAHREMAKHGRAGIGIHGGGSGLAHPFAAEQGWQVTHGCWRVQNCDLAQLVHLVTAAQGDGGKCYVTVQADAPGAAPEPGDGAPVAELAEGE